MKRNKLSAGGRPRKVDDLVRIDGQIRDIEDSFSGNGAFIMSGCVVTGSDISAGLVYIDGRILRVDARSNSSFPVYIKQAAPVESVPLLHETGGVLTTQIEYKAEYATAQPGSGQFITVSANGGRTFRDAWKINEALSVANSVNVRSSNNSLALNVNGKDFDVTLSLGRYNNANLNDVTIPGKHYVLGSSTVNAPPDWASGLGLMEVINVDNVIASQLLIEVGGNGAVWSRDKNLSGIWSAWSRLNPKEEDFQMIGDTGVLFRKDSAGFVHLQGRKPVGSSPVLPVGYRPAQTVGRLVLGRDSYASGTTQYLNLFIQSDGLILDGSGDGSNAALDLNGVSFKAA